MLNWVRSDLVADPPMDQRRIRSAPMEDSPMKDRTKRVLTTLATVLALAGAGFSSAGLARPFTDPRSDRSDSIDQAAALEPRDPACQARTLVSAGGAFPRNPHTLAVRWISFHNFELVYIGRLILLYSSYDS